MQMMFSQRSSNGTWERVVDKNPCTVRFVVVPDQQIGSEGRNSYKVNQNIRFSQIFHQIIHP